MSVPDIGPMKRGANLVSLPSVCWLCIPCGQMEPQCYAAAVHCSSSIQQRDGGIGRVTLTSLRLFLFITHLRPPLLSRLALARVWYVCMVVSHRTAVLPRRAKRGGEGETHREGEGGGNSSTAVQDAMLSFAGRLSCRSGTRGGTAAATRSAISTVERNTRRVRLHYNNRCALSSDHIIHSHFEGAVAQRRFMVPQALPVEHRRRSSSALSDMAV